MTTPALSPGEASGWSADAPEARLLVELLRNSRLSVMFAEAGSDKSTLLKSVLIPLLRPPSASSPVTDAPREHSVVVPFPDARMRQSARAAKRRREVVVYFDDWAESPAAALSTAIHQAVGTELPAPLRLHAAVGELSRRFDADFIILLDHFEDFAHAPADSEDAGRFVDELIEVLSDPQLPANFLIAVDEDARPHLGHLRRRIPGFDDGSLRLDRPAGAAAPGAPPASPAPAFPLAAASALAQAPTPVAGAAVPDQIVPLPPQPLPVLGDALPPPTADPPSAQVPEMPELAVARPTTRREPKAKRPPVPRKEITIDDVYALIDATLSRTTSEVARGSALNGEPFCPPQDQPARAPAGAADSTAGSTAADLALSAPRRGRVSWLRGAVARLWRRLRP